MIKYANDAICAGKNETSDKILRSKVHPVTF